MSESNVATFPNPSLDAALKWYKFGFRVIPMSEGDKKRQKKTATKWVPWLRRLEDEGEQLITEHWTANPRHGVGHVLTHDVIGFDTDDDDANDALAAIEKQHKAKSKLVIETSGGYHVYYRRAEGTHAHMRGFNTKEHPECIDIRTMRTADGGASIMVLPVAGNRRTVHTQNAATVQDLSVVDQAFIDAVFKHNGDEPPTEQTQSAPREGPPIKNEEAVELLSFIDPDMDGYDAWCQVGMALHDEYAGSDVGLSIWDDWSAAGASYEGYASLAAKYATFKHSKAGGVTVATIAKRAQDSGADLSAIGKKYPKKDAPPPKGAPRTLAELRAKYAVTDELLAQVAESKMIYPGMLVEGHIICIAGLPSAGKTTVCEYIAHKLGHSGHDVIYINADASPGDLKEAKRRATAGKYTLLNPDMQVGNSISEILESLRVMADGGDDLTGVVVFIDTLKKMTEVINKGKLKDFTELLRRLTARGMTLVLLSHCNKYNDKDGVPMYEGTGDLRADVDELFLLHAVDGDYGTREVSLYTMEEGRVPWAKDRHPDIEPQSWRVQKQGRVVEQLPRDEWVDTLTLEREKRQVRKYGELFESIKRVLLAAGEAGLNQTQVVEEIKRVGGAGRNAVLGALDKGLNKHWYAFREEGGKHNRIIYYEIDVWLAKNEQDNAK